MYDITVRFLRHSGYKVAVFHHRLKRNSAISPKGGKTEIIIDTPNGMRLSGIAVCSKEDNYNKKLGVRIALGRSGVADYI